MKQRFSVLNQVKMMSRKTFTQSLVAALVVCLWAICAPAALAHGGPARLELGAERVNPGGTLEVRGINIAPEQPVTLALIGAGTQFSLGTATGDAHGDFTQIVSLPAETAAGAYTLRAFGANRVIVSAPLTIAGAAAEEEEAGEQRDQDELLLAPMPQGQGAQAPAVQPRTSAAPVIKIPLWPLIALIAVVTMLGVAVAIRRRGASASQ